MTLSERIMHETQRNILADQIYQNCKARIEQIGDTSKARSVPIKQTIFSDVQIRHFYAEYNYVLRKY